MRLKRLELQGFKSFANSVTLQFGDGITAIVGPNGSGKSNIADAVRWVLGEQSAKSLRGQRMEDIIFAGSRGRRPLGMAQVHLTLDNSSGYLPLDYAEVTVGRRLFRSGESEFFINKQNCRLKDIHELFTDTGLGREGCAIIGQGQVDMVLSVRSEDRRILLEETAGIVKYRRRKEESLKKLDETNIDLLRVTDILGELQYQLGPLQKEAEKARLYLNLTNDLLQTELDCYCLDWQTLRQKQKEAKKSWERAKKEHEAGHSYYLDLEVNLADLKSLILALESQVKEKEDERLRLNEIHSEGLHKIQLYKERQKNNETRSNQLKRIINERSLELKKLEEEASAWQEQLEKTREKIALQEEMTTKKEISTKELEQKLENTKTKVNGLKNDFFEFMRELAERRNFQRTFQEKKKILQAQLESSQENYKKWVGALNTLENELAAVKDGKKAATEALRKIEQEQKNLEKIIEGNLADWEEINRSKNRLESRFAQLESRLKTLQELEAGYEGYGQGVRRIMRNRQLAPLVLGTVAEVVTVPAGLETAFEVALGAAVQNVITDSEEDAKKLIEWLKSARAGRVTFLPLATMRRRGFSPTDRALLSMPGVLGTGEELLEFAEKFRPALSSLLGRVVITEDLDAALSLKKRLKGFSRLVTRDGSVVFPTGAMTGGSVTTKTGLLTRKTEIAKLETELRNITQEISLQEKRSKTLVKKTDENKLRLEEFRDKVLLEKLKQQRLVERKNQIEAEMARGRKTSFELEEKIQDYGAIFESLGAEQEQAAAEVLQLEGEETLHRAEIQTKEQLLLSLEGEIQKSRERLTSHRVELAELKGNRENLAMQKSNTENRIDEVAQLVQEAKREENQLVRDGDFYQETVAETKKANAQNKISRANLKKELEKLQLKLEKLQDELENTEQSFAVANKEQVRKERVLYKWEIELEQLKNEEEEFLRALADEGLSLKEIVQRDVTEKKTVLRKMRDKLKRKINNLGLVNPRAAQEYDGIKERCDFLETQLNDLQEARQDLKDVIREMDKLCRTKLQRAFEQVRTEFQKLFTRLFRGGRADLTLTDPQSILTAGIDVLAQPPGKKLQNLLLLSGGERALTAIALLFAIRKVNPTPFCVLDEIDATLDESNLGLFAQLMQDFSSDTQFLVITHRQQTMEVAHTLYGVTMNQEAISQIISVALA